MLTPVAILNRWNPSLWSDLKIRLSADEAFETLAFQPNGTYWLRWGEPADGSEVTGFISLHTKCLYEGEAFELYCKLADAWIDFVYNNPSRKFEAEYSDSNVIIRSDAYTVEEMIQIATYWLEPHLRIYGPSLAGDLNRLFERVRKKAM